MEFVHIRQKPSLFNTHAAARLYLLNGPCPLSAPFGSPPPASPVSFCSLSLIAEAIDRHARQYQILEQFTLSPLPPCPTTISLRGLQPPSLLSRTVFSLLVRSFPLYDL